MFIGLLNYTLLILHYCQFVIFIMPGAPPWKIARALARKSKLLGQKTETLREERLARLRNSFSVSFCANTSNKQKHFFVTLWFNERFNQWQLSNASKNPDLLMTPLWDSRLERDLSKTFILLCPIQSISYCCNLCRVFSSCGEVFSNETTLWVWLTWGLYSTLQGTRVCCHFFWGSSSCCQII